MYHLSKEESDRINILKFICIIFVVFIHSYTKDLNSTVDSIRAQYPIWLDVVEYIISQVISRCGVPLFFVISSILLFKKKRRYLPTIKDKVKTLLIPYLFWNSIWIFVFFVLQNLPFTSVYFSGTPIKEYDFFDWLGLYGVGSQYPHDYPLWFMRDLMIVTLLFPIVDALTEKIPRVVLLLSVSLLLFPISFPFKMAIIWFCLGACVVKFSLHVSDIDKISMPIWGGGYVASVFVLTVLHVYGVECSSLSTAFIFIGIIFWVKITKYIYYIPALKNFFLKEAQWTFIIYVTHELTLSSVRELCVRILPNNQIVVILIYFIIPFVVISMCIMFGKFLKRFLPKIYKISTGSR